MLQKLAPNGEQHLPEWNSCVLWALCFEDLIVGLAIT
jgi:hypothetical protein